ncbi:MAG: hypothetical protein H7338_19290, partial [Candidatus Sericytochromatia bacterium]|nr:hypothetical protein [Candidatus Sericytochromatia bacterium]
MPRHFHCENDLCATWLLGDDRQARFHTGPIPPSMALLPEVLDPAATPRRSGKSSGTAPISPTDHLGTDTRTGLILTSATPIRDPGAQTFPDHLPAGGPTIGQSRQDPAQLERLATLMAPLPPVIRQAILDRPHAEAVPLLADVANCLIERISTLLPSGSLSPATLDRLTHMPAADSIRVLVDTLAQLNKPLSSIQAGPYLVRLERGVQRADDTLKQTVLARLTPELRTLLSRLPASLQDRALTNDMHGDLLTGDYSETYPADRIAENLIKELHAQCGLDRQSLHLIPPGLPEGVHAALFQMPAAMTIAALSQTLMLPVGTEPSAATLSGPVTDAVLQVLSATLPLQMRPAVSGLDPAVRLAVLTTGISLQSVARLDAVVQRNLAEVTREVVARLPGPQRNQAFRLLGVPRTAETKAPLSPPRSSVVVMATFLRQVPATPAGIAAGPPSPLSDSAKQRALANLAGLISEQALADQLIEKLDVVTRPVVKDLLRQGLLTASELVAMATGGAGGQLTDSTAVSLAVSQGLAALVAERLQLTDVHTFRPAVGEADAKGHQWQPQQIAAIATVVLKGLHDGHADGWANLHFALEEPPAIPDAALFDKDISGMRYGHFDAVPGKPPTMVFSALNATPRASKEVKDAWQKLWGEISTGQHFLGTGNVDARSMAGMLQTYLQAQQFSRILSVQQPVHRALALHVKKTAQRTPPDSEQRFAERLLMTNSGLRTDAVTRLWALHQTARLAGDSAVSDTVRAQANHRLKDYLGTVSPNGPEARQIRDFLGDDLQGLAPECSPESWLGNADGSSRREMATVIVPKGGYLPLLLRDAGGGRGPLAILAFLKLNLHLQGSQAITVTLTAAVAKNIGMPGRSPGDTITLSAAEFLKRVDDHSQALDAMRRRCHLDKAPTDGPDRMITLTAAEARRIGAFEAGFPDTSMPAARVFYLLQLAESWRDEGVRFAAVNIMDGAHVHMPPRTHGFSSDRARQMAIDGLDARTQMLAFVGAQLRPELVEAGGNRALETSIKALQSAPVPLQEDGRFGKTTMAALQALEKDSGMTQGFDPTQWYNFMLSKSMDLGQDDNFYVALATHEMAGHGNEEILLRRVMAPGGRVLNV